MKPFISVSGFTTGVSELMRASDLVLCRCGVGTLAEVTAVGLPGILVPGRFGGGHQEHNAAHLVAAGAAVRIVHVRGVNLVVEPAPEEIGAPEEELAGRSAPGRLRGEGDTR